MLIKIALPKGRLLAETAGLLQRANWGLDGYTKKARLYRFKSQSFPDLSARMFHEKDIPIQVAVGNYDLGICGLDWIEELLVKYPSSPLVKVKNLEYGERALYLLASRSGEVATVEEMQAKMDVIRIASEYSNLAEFFAGNLRLRRFSVFPLWGAAEVYPPENADLVLIPEEVTAESFNFNNDLMPLSKVFNVSAFLIANRSSWETKDMAELMASISDKLLTTKKHPPVAEIAGTPGTIGRYPSPEVNENIIRLALPDGHQQLPALQLLNRAGIQIDDYPSSTGNRRPTANLAGVAIKVIRPQDMPLQIANGNFDLAITGKDWLSEHLCRFPSSPITELLDLKFARVKIVAVVSNDLSVTDIDSLRQLNSERPVPLRVASEYVNIADKYARDNHLGLCRVIPTWGASEAFIPEDADLLIENTETGRTIARHNLKIIDTLFESTGCLIGSTGRVFSAAKSESIKSIIETLRTATDGFGLKTTKSSG